MSHSVTVPRVELAPGYTISRIIHGGWQLSQGHQQTTVATQTALRTLSGLADRGFTTFDCADIYTGVEEVFGRFLAERPGQDIQIHTKFVPDADVLPTITRRDVESIIDRSLGRLGIERLDLVQFHWWDYEVPHYVETAEWLDDLRRAGKIRLVGVTNFDVPHLEEILQAGVQVVSNQVQYSPLDRRPQHGVADLCTRHGLRLLCYGTLAGGFLTDRWLDREAPSEPLANRSLVKYRLMIDELGGWSIFRELLATLDSIARKHGVSIANVAARWTLDRPAVGAAIVGIGRGDYAAETARVFAFELDEEDQERLDRLLTRHPGATGDVYSVERIPDGHHAAIMRTRLNRLGNDTA